METLFKRGDIVIHNTPDNGSNLRLGIIKNIFKRPVKTYLKQQGFLPVGAPQGESVEVITYAIDFGAPSTVEIYDEDELLPIENVSLFHIKLK